MSLGWEKPLKQPVGNAVEVRLSSALRSVGGTCFLKQQEYEETQSKPATDLKIEPILLVVWQHGVVEATLWYE